MFLINLDKVMCSICSVIHVVIIDCSWLEYFSPERRLRLDRWQRSEVSIFCTKLKLVLFVWQNCVIICPESRGTYIATVLKILFLPVEVKLFSVRFGPLGLRNCNKIFVCLMSECKICHRPSGHSFVPICMKFSTLVYLWDT